MAREYCFIIEPSGIETRANGVEQSRLQGTVDARPLLCAVGAPPGGIRLVHRLQGAERDPPLIAEVKHDITQVIGEVRDAIGRQVVGLAIA
jgi:hypothetical protein